MTGSFVAIARSACYYDWALAREAVLRRLYSYKPGFVKQHPEHGGITPAQATLPESSGSTARMVAF